MITIAVNSTDVLEPLQVTCGCPSRRRVLPIRFAKHAAQILWDAMGPDGLVETYRCGDCGHIVQVRVRHLLTGTTDE